MTSCGNGGEGIGGLDDRTKDCRPISSPRGVRATEHHYMNAHQLHKPKKPPDKLHTTLMKSAFANTGKVDGNDGRDSAWGADMYRLQQNTPASAMHMMASICSTWTVLLLLAFSIYMPWL